MKIISGGQSGADRTALEIARDLGIPTGGWAPLGWRTDDGADPDLAEFGLLQTTDHGYPNRTRMNVRDSDGTVLFGNLDSPGCTVTRNTCIALGKPYLENPTADNLTTWIVRNHIQTLNVAGNRRRTNPTIVWHVKRILKPALEQVLKARKAEEAEA